MAKTESDNEQSIITETLSQVGNLYSLAIYAWIDKEDDSRYNELIQQIVNLYNFLEKHQVLCEANISEVAQEKSLGDSVQPM